MSIAAALPWKDILQALPSIVATARRLWGHWSSQPGTAPIDPRTDVKTQLASIAERLVSLESAEADQAKLVSQIAEQLQGIARRVSIAYWLGLGGLLLSCIALLVAVFR